MLREHLSITSTHKYHVCYSRTPASNQSTEDLVHVSMKNDKSNFVCANGSGCSRFRIKISKKRTTASLCPHEHIVQLMSGKTAENSEEVPQEQERSCMKIFSYNQAPTVLFSPTPERQKQRQ